MITILQLTLCRFGDLLEKKLKDELTKDENSDVTKYLKKIVKSKEKYHTRESTVMAGYSKEERDLRIVNC